MKALIVEDDFTSRLLLQELLKDHCMPHVAVNGNEAVDAVKAALAAGEPYDLICLDIMLPEMDGQDALRLIRQLEEGMAAPGTSRAKIVMMTALTDKANVLMAGKLGCDHYLVKPIRKEMFLKVMKTLDMAP